MPEAKPIGVEPREEDSVGDRIARKIRSELDRRGWKDYQLADEAGVSQATLSLLLRGKTKDPTLQTLARIAKGLDVDFLWLVEDALVLVEAKTGREPTLPAAPGAHPLSLGARFDALATEVAEGFEEAGQTRLQFVRLVEILASEPGLPEKTRKRLRLVLQQEAS